MKKLFRFLLIILFVSSFDTSMYAMIEEKNVKPEQKIPKIQKEKGGRLCDEINGLLRQQYTSESIVTAIKQQNIDVNERNDEEWIGFVGWTPLQIQAFYIGQSKKKTEKEILYDEMVMQILVGAGAEIDARNIDITHEYNNLTALELLAKMFVRIEKIKTPRLLISHGADTSRVMALRKSKRGGEHTARKKLGMVRAIRDGLLDKEAREDSIETLTDVLKLASLS